MEALTTKVTSGTPYQLENGQVRPRIQLKLSPCFRAESEY